MTEVVCSECFKRHESDDSVEILTCPHCGSQRKFWTMMALKAQWDSLDPIYQAGLRETVRLWKEMGWVKGDRGG